MDLACKFAQEYLPIKSDDPVAIIHVENCPDCQEQVAVL